MLRKEELLGKWRDYKISAKEKTRKNLEFKYRKQGSKKAFFVVEALIFWKFIQQLMPWNDKDVISAAWMKRQELLSVFNNNPNPLIKIIVMIEALPTMVWRKLLWKHNIDFMSFESFLRRISKDQIAAIADNYNDLYVSHNVPRVFSWWNRFWGKLSVEKIFSESYEYDKRYCNKGAMSYNLLGLDFGFNAYPKGVSDDERVIEVSPLRFLSIKNHADDFVVNQETSGKYWWLYKNARSNYVWFPSRDVQLKTHICPGFWYTIFIHLFFWIISPAMFAGLMTIFALRPFYAVSLWIIGALGIPGLITPLWISAALVKRVINSKGFEWLKEFLDRHEEGTKIFMAIAIIVGFLSLMGRVLWEIYKALSIGLGPAWSILTMVAVSVYIGYKIYFKTRPSNYQLPRFKEYPLYLRILLLFFVGVLMGAHPWAVKKVISIVLGVIVWGLGIVASFCLKLWGYLVMMGPLAIFVALYLILAGLIWYITTIDDEKKQEKFFNYLGKTMLFMSYAACVTFLLLFFVSLTSYVHEFYLFFTLVSAIIILLQKMVIWSLTPTVKEGKEMARYANRYLCYSEFKISRALILQNTWLKTLDKQAKIDVLREVIGKIKFIFGSSDDMSRSLDLLVPIMTRNILDAIEEEIGGLLNCVSKYRFMVFKNMVSGHSFNEALVLAKEEVLKEELLTRKRARQWETTKSFLKVIFSPFIFLWWILKSVFKVIFKLKELVMTFYRLYELFNERCPYVTQKRILRMD